MTDLEKAIEKKKEAYKIYFIRCREINSVKLSKGILDEHNSKYKEAYNVFHKKNKEIKEKYKVKARDEDFLLFETYKRKSL